MELKSKKLIFMFPKDCMCHSDSKLVKLKHPLTENSTYFIIDTKERKVFEVQNFNENQRSWFYKGNVLSDGSIKIVTPYNPAFLILPHLIKAQRNTPLDQLLDDEKYPDTHLLANIVEDISCIADRIGSASLNVWKYNENSTLNWLTSKVDKLAKTLLENKEKPSLTSSVTNNEEMYRVLAFGIISDNLPKEVSTKLKIHLKLPEPSLDDEKENCLVKESKRTVVEEEIKEPKAKKANVVKKTAKEKALAKSAKGTKSIASFFSKK